MLDQGIMCRMKLGIVDQGTVRRIKVVCARSRYCV